MLRGFLYLVAILDWRTRMVLAWRISDKLDVNFCVEALFTSFALTDRLRRSGTRISTDGKGCYRDKIFIEHLRRAPKCERVYLHTWENRTKARADFRQWIEFYNHRRLHKALGGRPPAVV